MVGFHAVSMLQPDAPDLGDSCGTQMATHVMEAAMWPKQGGEAA